MGTYEQAFYAAVNLSSNMKHIHFHAVGKLFDMIHSIYDEYYKKASEDIDTLAELALENNQTISNPGYAATDTGYGLTNQKEYNFEQAMKVASNSIAEYLKVIFALRKEVQDPSAQSLLDDILRYWMKELEYKIKARLANQE